MHHILLIESDSSLANMVVNELEELGFKVTWRQEYIAGIFESISSRYSLVVVNAARPDGLQTIKRIRARGIDVPILAMLNNYNDMNINNATVVGADGFLALPYRIETLRVKIAHMVKRQPRSREDVLFLGEVSIDRGRRRVSYLDRKVDLKKREYDIFLLLAEQRGKVIRRELLNDATCATSRSTSDSTVDVHISKIRSKLRNAGVHGHLIDTIYGIGYRIS